MTEYDVSRMLNTYNMLTDEGKRGFAKEVITHVRRLSNKLADAKLRNTAEACVGGEQSQLRVSPAPQPKVTLELPDSMKETHSIVTHWSEWRPADNHMYMWIDVRKNK